MYVWQKLSTVLPHFAVLLHGIYRGQTPG